MSDNTPENAAEPHRLVAEAEQISAQISAARAEIEKLIFGQTKVIDLALTAVLSGGHAHRGFSRPPSTRDARAPP